jgi:hypothetical protein
VAWRPAGPICSLGRVCLSIGVACSDETLLLYNVAMLACPLRPQRPICDFAIFARDKRCRWRRDSERTEEWLRPNAYRTQLAACCVFAHSDTCQPILLISTARVNCDGPATTCFAIHQCTLATIARANIKPLRREVCGASTVTICSLTLRSHLHDCMYTAAD